MSKDANAELIEKLRSHIQELGREEKWDEIFSLLNEELRKNKNSTLKSEIYSFRGQAHARKEEYDKAIADYSKAIGLEPNNAEFHRNLGNVYALQENYDKAIDIDPKRAEFYALRGMANSDNGNHDKGIEDYNKAIELEPANAKFYGNRGELHTRNKKYRYAIEDYNKAIGLEPNNANFHGNLGNAYALQKNFDQAIENYDKAIDIDPERAEFYAVRGMANSDNGNHDNGIEDYNKAIELDPNNAKFYGNRGKIHALNGEYSRAIEDCNKAIELKPNNAEFYGNRGKVHTLNWEYSSAIEDYNKAINIEPDEAEFYALRGAACYNTGDYTRAIEDYNKAIELDHNNAEFYGDRGRVHARNGNYSRTIEDCNKAIKLAPDNAEFYANLGKAYALTVNYARTIAEYDKAISLEPKNADFYVVQAAAYFDTRNYPDGIKNHNIAIKLEPANAKFYIYRATANCSYNNYEEGMKDFLESDRLNPNLKSENPYVYMANRINATPMKYNDRIKSLELLMSLTFVIRNIKEVLFYKNARDADLAHYTSLYALRNLSMTGQSNKNSFRLYNATHMSDPQEGEEFFKILDIPEFRKTFYENYEDKSPISPAYIASFNTVDIDSRNIPDKLTLWRFYGKHNDDEAAGACLIFKSSQFVKEASDQIGDMAYLQTGAYIATQGRSQIESKPPLTRLPLYAIAYTSGEIQDHISKLRRHLIEAKEFFSGLNVADSSAFASLVREVLDEIRFLFKSQQFQEEKEVRAVWIVKDKTPVDVRLDVDTEKLPPRPYLTFAENIKFYKVVLGPKVTDLNTWRYWLNTQRPDLQVEKSKIPFGEGNR